MNDEENTPETVAKTDSAPAPAKGPSPDSEEVRAIIRKNVYLAMGVGVVTLPYISALADLLVQVKMVRELCKVYNVEYKESWVKNIISSVVGGLATTAIKPTLERAALGLPVVGLPLAVATLPALNGMTTYAIGRMFAQHFHTGGGLINCGVKELTDSFSSAFQSSREWIGGIISGNGSKSQATAS